MSVTPSVAGLLQLGLDAHRHGRLSEALKVYGDILDRAPRNPRTRHLRGFALLQLKRPSEAVADLTIAVQLAPSNETVRGHLVLCLDLLDDPSAVDQAQRLLLLNPAAREPLDVLSKTDSLAPRAVRWAAVAWPADPTSWIRLGLARAASAPPIAAPHLMRAVALAPNDAATMLDLADLQRTRKLPLEARRLAEYACILRPYDPRGLAERAAASLDLYETHRALTDTRVALVQDPSSSTAWTNQAEALCRRAAYGEAVKAGERARQCAPLDQRVLGNLGAYLLATGDLTRGWPLFAHRPARRYRPAETLPHWTGEADADVAVLAEQGLGDELLFSTLWCDLSERVENGSLASVTVEVDPRLVPLAERRGTALRWRGRDRRSGATMPLDGNDGFTHWCLSGDLPAILRQHVADFSVFHSGLAVDPDRVSAFRAWLAEEAAGRPTIGFCWRSGSREGHRDPHYPTIEDCLPVLHLPDRLFVVLQYDDCAEEVARAPLCATSDLRFPKDLDRRDDQDGLAALVSALDGVITADTAVAALCGALGTVRTLAFGLPPGWVHLGRPGSPWFPSVDRVERQPERAWLDTMKEVTDRAQRMGF